MTTGQSEPWTVRDRIQAVLEGRVPDRLPFADRLELWYRHHRRAATLPAAFQDLSLSEIHRAVGMGEQVFVSPCLVQLVGVEVLSTLDGEEVYRRDDPLLEGFPDAYDLFPRERSGVLTTEFRTPVGKLAVVHQLLDSMIEAGIVRPYLRRHPIREEADYRTAEYILERAEPRPQPPRVESDEARIGGHGWAVPLLPRIPFQLLLLEYLGEEALFYALHDFPGRVGRLLGLLDEYMTRMLQSLAALPAPYVELCDNLEGAMTNPRLYARYGLPFHQRYSAILHAQGKRVGSHTDGNLKPLLRLLAESGLDVCESVTPAPVTECTLDEILKTWERGPIIRDACAGGTFDMQQMVGQQSPAQVRGFNEEMLHYYGLPGFGIGGNSGAETLDGQAAMEAALSLLTSVQAGAHLIHDVGYLDNGTTGSLAQLVICDEIVAWIKACMKPLVIDDETLALDDIRRVVREGGDFTGSRNTARHFREAYYPRLLDRGIYASWLSAGAHTLDERAREQVDRLLARPVRERLTPEQVQQIDQVMNREVP